MKSVTIKFNIGERVRYLSTEPLFEVCDACGNKTLKLQSRPSAEGNVEQIVIGEQGVEYIVSIEGMKYQVDEAALIAAEGVSANATAAVVTDTEPSGHTASPSTMQVTPPVQQREAKPLVKMNKEEILEADRVVNFFVNERRAVQPNFAAGVNIDRWKYEMRVHLAEGARTARQYYDMIRWLYSGEKEAEFWRNSINTVAGLIKNYDAVEMKFLAKSGATDTHHTRTMYANVLRKQGLSDEEIVQRLQEEGLI